MGGGGQCPLGVSHRLHPGGVHQGCQKAPSGSYVLASPTGTDTCFSLPQLSEITLDTSPQMAFLGPQGCNDVTAMCLVITKEGAKHVPVRVAHSENRTILLHSIDVKALAILFGNIGKDICTTQRVGAQGDPELLISQEVRPFGLCHYLKKCVLAKQFGEVSGCNAQILVKPARSPSRENEASQ